MKMKKVFVIDFKKSMKMRTTSKLMKITMNKMIWKDKREKKKKNINKKITLNSVLNPNILKLK